MQGRTLEQVLDERQGKRDEELESSELEEEEEELEEELLLSHPASQELQMHSSLGPAGH